MVERSRFSTFQVYKIDENAEKPLTNSNIFLIPRNQNNRKFI